MANFTRFIYFNAFLCDQQLITDHNITSNYSVFMKLQSNNDFDTYLPFAFGITCTSVGPCLVDLKNLFKQKDVKVSILSDISLEVFVSGFVYKKINRQIRTILLLILLGISLIFIPRASLYVLYACGFVIGIGGGSWDSTYNVWIIEMWRHKSAPILQLSQFAFGLGSIVGPLIDKPYIVGDTQDNLKGTVEVHPSLGTPFAIIGSTQLLGAIFMLIMYLIKKYEKPEPIDYNIDIDTKDVEKETTDSADNRVKLGTDSGAPVKTIITLCAICFASFTVVENCHFQFSATFNQYIPLKLCAPKAALILSLMASCFTLGRGLGLSAMWALMLSFIDQYIVITEQIGSVLIFTVGVMSAATPILIGAYIETEPMILVIY
ncbi:unnamed protein product [Medioppia subpectinata]|uniref:Sodium-dependent glucose transporter 1-like protein n=1 Tax=Medioppia subpectinata TaxID=1979941 RepID=A0A7R9KD71_9ACAR|nr:unnamed protein product [Medioppia subpectinata]CAG2100448.1 unnamed protein product [Medioppia subpectinata]